MTLSLRRGARLVLTPRPISITAWRRRGTPCWAPYQQLGWLKAAQGSSSLLGLLGVAGISHPASGPAVRSCSTHLPLPARRDLARLFLAGYKCSTCELAWNQWSRHCYFQSEKQMTWQQGLKFCLKKDASLLKVSKMQELVGSPPIPCTSLDGRAQLPSGPQPVSPQLLDEGLEGVSVTAGLHLRGYCDLQGLGGGSCPGHDYVEEEILCATWWGDAVEQ